MSCRSFSLSTMVKTAGSIDGSNHILYIYIKGKMMRVFKMAQPPVGHDILSSLQEIESLYTHRVCAFCHNFFIF